MKVTVKDNLVSPRRCPEPLAEASILDDRRESVMIGYNQKRNPLYSCPEKVVQHVRDPFPSKRTHIVK
jgi:hypothetical protein